MAYGIVSTQSVNSSGSELKLNIGDVKNANGYGGNYSNSLNWEDPIDVVVNDVTIVTWAGTKVVRKVGSAPNDVDDGTLVLDSKARDAYKTAAFVDEVEANNVDYFYRFFPYTTAGVVTNGATISARPTEISVSLPDYIQSYKDNNQSIVYNTASHNAPITPIDTDKVIAVSGITGTNAGSYTAVYRLNGKYYKWSDGSYTDKSFTWQIVKADAAIIVPTDQAQVGTGIYVLNASTRRSITMELGVINTDSGVVLSMDTSHINTGLTYAIATLNNRTFTISRPDGNTNEGQGTIIFSTNETANYKPASATITVKAQNYKYMCVRIDQGQSDPGFSCSYPQSFTAPALDEQPEVIFNNDAYGMKQVYYGINCSSLAGTGTIASLAAAGNYTKIQELRDECEQRSELWDDFFGHYPCLLQNDTASTVDADLNPVKETRLNSKDIRYVYGEDSLTANPTKVYLGGGSAAVSVNTAHKDCPEVMVCFPRRGLRIWKEDNPDKSAGNKDYVFIAMTDCPDDPSFEYMAHQRGKTQKDKFYLGAYMANVSPSVAASGSLPAMPERMHSWISCRPSVSRTIGNFRTVAQNNGKPNGHGGSGWDQHGYYQLVYIISMYCLKYAHLNSQEQIGQGFVNGNSSYHNNGCNDYTGVGAADNSAGSFVPENNLPPDTLATSFWGMDTSYAFDNPRCYTKNGVLDSVQGTRQDQTTGKKALKIFGIEDLYGNLWSWIDGLWSDTNRKIWTATENFNDSASQSSVYADSSSPSFISTDATAYVDRGSTGFAANFSGYLTRIQGDTHKAFIAAPSVRGDNPSSSTSFCDQSWFNPNNCFSNYGYFWSQKFGVNNQNNLVSLNSGLFFTLTGHVAQNGEGKLETVARWGTKWCSSRLMYL